MKEIILVGGGGHCISCIDVIEDTELYKIKGILDLSEMVGQKILNYSVLGTDNDMETLINNKSAIFITIGKISAGESLREKLFAKAISLGAFLPSIISPHSYVSKHASIGAGSIVLSGSVINGQTKIGENCIINSGAIIEHGATISDHCHISTGAIVNGDCKVGDNCFIASGAVIRNGVSITNNTLIGMGAVVTGNVTESGVYYGNPIRKVK